MKRPTHPELHLPLNLDGSLELRRNLAIILCALHTTTGGILESKERLLDKCEEVCSSADIVQRRGNLKKSASEKLLRTPFLTVTKTGTAKQYALTDSGRHLITYAQLHPVKHLSALLRESRDAAGTMPQ